MPEHELGLRKLIVDGEGVLNVAGKRWQPSKYHPAGMTRAKSLAFVEDHGYCIHQ
jgi:hypothetical protein